MAHNSRLTAVVLAAGRGKRLKSDVPKVLHRAGGLPLVAHVLAALRPLEADEVIVVTSPAADLASALREQDLPPRARFVTQDPPRGTGDAVRVALEPSGGIHGEVLIVNGDTPLIETETLRSLVDDHRAGGAAATVLTAEVRDPDGLGRIVRGRGNEIAAIVEEADADPEQRAIREINGGAFVFDASRLVDMLGKVDTKNAQGEYYLTDVIGLLRAADEMCIATLTTEEEVAGVNDRRQLAAVGAVLRKRICERWMSEGVTIVDPSTTYIDATVAIERDATILPSTYLEGETTIGARAEIGPETRVVDSTIEEGASVTFSVVRGSHLGPDASVGPYASLRPGTRLERGAHLGTFVESKKTIVGEGSKANHLSYLGDARIGRGVNIGAGTITCNWDGREKHESIVDDDAYIGSDTMLVAPVKVGKRAATGAGSVVRGDVPDDALAVGAPARVIEGKGDKMDRGSSDHPSEDEGKDDGPTVG